MLEFLVTNLVSVIDTAYLPSIGGMIEGRINVYFKSGGHFQYWEKLPISSDIEFLKINQEWFEERAKKAIHEYIESTYIRIQPETIVKVLPHCPTLKNCLGVVTDYAGDDLYSVYFQPFGICKVGKHYLSTTDMEDGIWDVTNHTNAEGVRLLTGKQRKR